MSIGQIGEFLHDLRAGKLDAAGIGFFAGSKLSEVAKELQRSYPILLQERRVGHKHEVGYAQAIEFRLTPRRLPDSRFIAMQLWPVLRRCLFVSSYDDLISGVAQFNEIRLRPHAAATGSFVMKTGRGRKLDKIDETWQLKRLAPKAVTLSEDFLAKRGWKFESLVPFQMSH